jgi:alpha-D-ribose 1-methylphosphonate 5-triphosphate synthase subunit PhnH
MTLTAIRPAFHDAPRESQAIFRAVMTAMARPGWIGAISVGFDAPAPLDPLSAAILIALADFETPVWLGAALAEVPAVAEFLRFHTGARLVTDPRTAAFALIADSESAPPLAAFAQGTPDYPDRSTTLILQVASLKSSGWRLAGPGIEGEARFSAAPLPADFPQQLSANRARFPLGVDVIFASRAEMAALPRSTRLLEAH